MGVGRRVHAYARTFTYTHTRTHVRAKAGDGVLHGGSRHAESGCDPQRSSAQAAGCRCRPRGAGVQQNISKRVWARFRSVRQSLRPTLPADPSFTRVSSRAALVSATYVIRPRECAPRARPATLPFEWPPLWPRSQGSALGGLREGSLAADESVHHKAVSSQGLGGVAQTEILPQPRILN